MKYRLETIRIWRAYEQPGDCPLCRLRAEAEERQIDFFLGSSVMSPAIRMEVNEAGFCPRHYRLLFTRQEGKLGLALITHTHLAAQLQKLQKNSRILLHGLRAGERKVRKRARRLAGSLARKTESCVICPRIARTCRRYAFTVVREWERDEAFRAQLLGSQGFCLTHFALVMELAVEVLPRQALTLWCEQIIPLQEKTMGDLQKELLAFTQRFDYRQSGGKWGSERDSLRRAIGRLEGRRAVPP